MSVNLMKALALALTLATSVVSTTADAAIRGETQRTDGPSIVVDLNEGQLVRLNQDAESVFIANPEVADVTVKSSRLIYVFGRVPGETSFYAVDANDQIIANTKVVVRHNISRLQAALNSLLPNGGVTAISIDGGIILNGSVKTATDAENVRRLANRFIAESEEVINQVSVTEPNQINIRVRFAEVSREINKALGFDWDVIFDNGDFFFDFFSTPQEAFLDNFIQTGGSQGDLSVSALIDLLEDDNLLTLLAEPNLTALSGETASFLAGGEFPVPVSEDEDTIGISFKDFGISLGFTPTLVGDNRISMKVRPEVSELSDEARVTLATISVPSLTVRRAETTIEMGSGQSFMIAGLLRNRTESDSRKYPGLGDLPILGALFNSDAFQRNESELVIIVTAYIVEPSSERLADPVEPYTARAPQADTREKAVASSYDTATVPLQTSSTEDGGTTSSAGFIIE